MPKKAPKNMMSGRGATAYLNLAPETFKRLVDAGEIPFWEDPMTGRRRYPRLALDEWMKSFASTVTKRSAS